MSAEDCSGKEIAGLLRKIMMMNMTRKIVKSRVSGFSRGNLEAGKNELGFCTARDESMSCCCVFSRHGRLSLRVSRRFVRGSREISLPT